MLIRFNKKYRACEDGVIPRVFEEDEIAEVSDKVAGWAIGDGAAAQVEAADSTQEEAEEEEEIDEDFEEKEEPEEEEEETNPEKSKTEVIANKALKGPSNKRRR